MFLAGEFYLLSKDWLIDWLLGRFKSEREGGSSRGRGRVPAEHRNWDHDQDHELKQLLNQLPKEAGFKKQIREIWNLHAEIVL